MESLADDIDLLIQDILRPDLVNPLNGGPLPPEPAQHPDPERQREAKPKQNPQAAARGF
jgi:hypothetical protein